MTAVGRNPDEILGEQEIEHVALRVRELQDECPGSFACWSATCCLALVLLVHAASGLHAALLPLYVLPVWVAVHFDGVRSGAILVGLSAMAATFFHWKTGNAVGAGSILFSAFLSTSTFSVMMLLMARMEELVSQSRDLALRDPLTGLFNRRALKELATKTIGRALQKEKPVIVVAIDCDGFKQLNDAYGHGAGDEVLRILANVLERHTRDSDVVARVGGDEFVIVLNGVDPANARSILQRVEREFEFAVQTAGYECTITVGMATMEADDQTIDSLLTRADEAMYVSKESKKNRAYLN